MMERGFGESISRQTPSPSSSSSNNNSSDAETFECNICFDLAQDPILTLCGHLFCWPCLYKWLHVYSRSRECPVCKALIEEEKLVPLYGRGKNSTDPWSKSIPGMEIPHRPTLPETASPLDPNANAFAEHGFGFVRGFVHFRGVALVVATRFGNFALFQSFLNSQLHGFRNATMSGAGAAPGFHYQHSNVFNGQHAYGFPGHSSLQQLADFALKFFLLVTAFSVIVGLVWS